MEELKHIQISKLVWKDLKEFCSNEGYSLKGYVEKLIIKNLENEKMLEMQRGKGTQ